ncbi:MAG: response regulator [Pirellulales bacterium]
MIIIYLTADLMFSSRACSFAKDSGADLRVAVSGAQCINAINQNKVDRVLIDLNVPKLDIEELMTQIKATGQNLEVIAYGPHVHIELLEAAKAAGCNAVLSKGQFNQQIESLVAG